MFRNDLLRAFRSPNWVIVVLIAFIVAALDVIISFAGAIVQGTPWNHMAMNSFAAYRSMWLFSSLFFVMPLVCVLPYGVSISDEIVSGQLRLLVYRTGRRRYLWTRLASVSLCGGAACAVMVLLIGAVSLLLFPLQDPQLPADQMLQDLQHTSLLFKGATSYQDNIVFALLPWELLQCFIGGCIWSVVSLGISVWFPNRYFAMAAPVVFYAATAMVFGMVGGVVPFLFPYLLFSDALNISTWLGQVLMRLGWLGFGLCLYFLGGRRLMRGV